MVFFSNACMQTSTDMLVLCFVWLLMDRSVQSVLPATDVVYLAGHKTTSPLPAATAHSWSSSVQDAYQRKALGGRGSGVWPPADFIMHVFDS